MIESIENGIQLVTTAVCTALSVCRAVRSEKRIWLLLALSSGVYFLGDLYWQLFLIFYGETPDYSFIPYLGWYAGYVFLLLLLLEVRGPRPAVPRSRLLWLFPVFTVGMGVFYLQWGDWIGNITAAILMSLLLWHTTDCVLLWRRDPLEKGKRCVADGIILFCAAEYAAWTSSCFWMGDTLKNPYFWFDTLLSICFLLFPWALRKAEEQ